MPSKVQPRGDNKYRLTVSAGRNGLGKQLIHRKTVIASNLSEAKKLWIQFAADVERGLVSADSGMTVSDLYFFWRKNHAEKHHALTTLEYNDYIFCRIQESLGHIRIGKLTPKHLLAFYDDLAQIGVKKQQKRKDGKKQVPEKLSGITVRKHHSLLSTMLNAAVRWNLIGSNPCERVVAPRYSTPKKKIYDQETLGNFLALLEGEETSKRLWALIALCGGLRREEIFGLEWSHVDFEAGTLSIEQASVYVSGVGTLTKEPKNRSSRRIVSLPGTVMNLLRQHQMEQDRVKKELGDQWQECGRVFTQWNGKTAHPHSFNRWIQKFCDRQGLPRISPHVLRHMSATYLISAGVDVRTVSGKLGHSRTSTTLEIYSHLVTEAEKKTAETMERFLVETKERRK